MDIYAINPVAWSGEQRAASEKEIQQVLEKTGAYYNAFLSDTYRAFGYDSIESNYSDDDWWEGFSFVPFYDPYSVLFEFEAVVSFKQADVHGLNPSIELVANTLEEIDSKDFMDNYI